MGSEPGEPAGDGPRGAILWRASGAWGREGEVAKGGISFFAVRLRVVGAVGAWEGGLGYRRLSKVSRGEEFAR